MIGIHEGQGSKKPPPERVFTLPLSVTACQPRIWRRGVVRESMWLARLPEAS